MGAPVAVAVMRRKESVRAMRRRMIFIIVVAFLLVSLMVTYGVSKFQ